MWVGVILSADCMVASQITIWNAALPLCLCPA